MTNKTSSKQFRRQRLLGRGGTADVFLVQPPATNHQFALKVPLDNSLETEKLFRTLAAREFDLIGDLKFPGLARLLQPYDDAAEGLLIEYCPGKSLDQLGIIEDQMRLFNILSAVAVDLEFLRLCGIIHGDLKPHNIFLPEHLDRLQSGKLSFCKLSDFSLGRHTEESDDVRAGVGTVGYMAPETVITSQVSPRSDLFALGVIAYQLAAGIHPFLDAGSDPVKTNARVREETPPSLSDIVTGLPTQFVELINQLLSKELNDRPGNAWQVCSVLESCGATYPFRKALNPRFFPERFWQNAKSYFHILNLTDSQHEEFEEISQNSPLKRRQTVSVNYSHGYLRHDGSRYTLHQNWYWVAKHRRELIRNVVCSPLSQKRRIVKAALVGSAQSARSMSILSEHEHCAVTDKSLSLILALLNVPAVKALAGRLATHCEAQDLPAEAARLHLLAGDLTGALRSALAAVKSLTAAHHNTEALRLIGRVVEYAELSNVTITARQLLMMKGDIYKQQGDTSLALETYQRIVELYEGLPVDELLGETYKDLGDLYRMRQETDAGLQALLKAKSIYTELGNQLELSKTLNNIGNIHWVSSHLPEAQQSYRQALRIQRRLRAMPEVASTLGNIGSIYALWGRYRRSIQVMELSLSLKRTIGNEGEIARSLNNLGYVHHISGRSGDAISYLIESLEINRRIGSKKEVLFNLENLTAVMIIAGRLVDAVPYLEEGLSLAEELHDRAHLATFHLSRSQVAILMGHVHEAAASLVKVEEYVRDISDRSLLINVKYHKAQLRQFVGDYGEAVRLAQFAYDEAASINDRAEQLRTLLTLTRLQRSEKVYDTAIALADELHFEREKFLCQGNMLERRMADVTDEIPESEVNSFAKGLTALREDCQRPRLCNIAAELLLRRNRMEPAVEFIKSSHESALAANQRPELAVAMFLQARIAQLKGEYEAAYRLLRQAFQIHKEIASEIVGDVDKHHYMQQRSIVQLTRGINELAIILGTKKQQAVD
jgi:serine/threonine protein kinase